MSKWGHLEQLSTSKLRTKKQAKTWGHSFQASHQPYLNCSCLSNQHRFGFGEQKSQLLSFSLKVPSLTLSAEHNRLEYAWAMFGELRSGSRAESKISEFPEIRGQNFIALCFFALQINQLMQVSQSSFPHSWFRSPCCRNYSFIVPGYIKDVAVFPIFLVFCLRNVTISLNA